MDDSVNNPNQQRMRLYSGKDRATVKGNIVIWPTHSTKAASQRRSRSLWGRAPSPEVVERLIKQANAEARRENRARNTRS